MSDLKSIFFFNGVNYHDLKDSDKAIFDKLIDILRNDFKNVQLTVVNYFDVSRDKFGELSFESFIPEPLNSKIWVTLVELKNNNIF